MEGKINTHLFIMGLVTAILVSLITWLVFFNAFQNQVNADLKTDAQLIATAMIILQMIIICKTLQKVKQELLL